MTTEEQSIQIQIIFKKCRKIKFRIRNKNTGLFHQ